MLFFLSKGYFASGNCRKEIAATIRNKNPIILLHETDPARGGIPISHRYTTSLVSQVRDGATKSLCRTAPSSRCAPRVA